MSEKSMKNVTLKELIQDIDFRLSHIEDIESDNRKLMVKLIKQGNSIVEFLKQFDIDDADPLLPELSSEINIKENERIVNLKELLDEYMEKHEDLKEFEEELKKHKDDITPGTIGES
jgi:hypothetical protein